MDNDAGPCSTQGSNRQGCEILLSILVCQMWTDVDSIWARCEMPLPILVRQQSADVDSMWDAIAYTSATNVDPCGLDVDSL